MRPAPVDRCRVLELGCADGGNLLPMAVALPDSHFVGIDYAPRQTAAGQAVVDALGLANVSLLARDVRDVGDDLGQFDYVIAYGIYSWAPPDVQEALLRECKERLAPNGVAFVSYNTYPGWHFRGMVREMLIYHVGQIPDVQERVAQARAFLDYLVEAGPALRERFSKSRFAGEAGPILEAERGLLRERSDSYLAHELLEDVNTPVYFHEFVARAEQHGLQYLAEAEFAMMQFDNLPEPAVEGLRRFSRTRIQAEQYMDFLCNRTFRQTLLCHTSVELAATPTAIVDLAIASPVEPVEAMADGPDTGAGERFRAPNGSVVQIRHPLSAAALRELHACWPQALPFRELLRRARARLGPTPAAAGAASSQGDNSLEDPDAVRLAQQLLHCYGVDLVEVRSHLPAFTVEISARPKACPLARYQAQRGLPVANRRHEVVRLPDGIAPAALALLDGRRDRAVLLAALHEHADRVDNAALDDALRLLARSALLVG
jgi:SAM-dependent methyltransferase